MCYNLKLEDVLWRDPQLQEDSYKEKQPEMRQDCGVVDDDDDDDDNEYKVD